MELIRKSDKRDGWYMITPGVAQKLLDERAPNRPLNERRSLKYAAVMSNGGFSENGEPIIVDESGALIDGQHRMRAVVVSNKPYVSYVIHAIPRKMFATIDDCAKRTGADVLSIQGIKHSAACAAVARWLIKAARGEPMSGGGGGKYTPRSIPNEETSKVLKKNRGIEESVSFCLEHELEKLMPISIGSFVHFMAAKTDKRKADRFIELLGSGEGLVAGSPILALRKRMISLKGSKHTIRPDEKLALTIKAWLHFKSDNEVGVLKVNRTRTKGGRPERFPWFDDPEVAA